MAKPRQQHARPGEGKERALQKVATSTKTSNDFDNDNRIVGYCDICQMNEHFRPQDGLIMWQCVTCHVLVHGKILQYLSYCCCCSCIAAVDVDVDVNLFQKNILTLPILILYTLYRSLLLGPQGAIGTALADLSVLCLSVRRSHCQGPREGPLYSKVPGNHPKNTSHGMLLVFH
jgi:hypothetical protein